MPIKYFPPLPASGELLWGDIAGVIEQQVDLKNLLDAKADVSHNHTSLYYNKTEIETALAGKSDVGHNHSGIYEPANSNIQSHISDSEIHVPELPGDTTLFLNGNGAFSTPETNNSPGFDILTATMNDCENTTNLVDLWSITIPADSWLDGEIIEVIYYSERLQNSGSTNNLISSWAWGAIGTSGILTGVSNSSTTGKSLKRDLFLRYGSDLIRFGSNASISGDDNIGTAFTTTVDSMSTGYIWANAGFDTQKILKGQAQWINQNASSYIRMKYIYARKWRVS